MSRFLPLVLVVAAFSAPNVSAVETVSAPVSTTSSEFVPDRPNAVYAHPFQIGTMVFASAVPNELGLTWLQLDYERFIKPGFSAIGGVQYFDVSPKGSSKDELQLGFVDVLAGIRWYTNDRFSGFYLQPQLNYNHIGITKKDPDQSWTANLNRYGVSGLLGFNGKWTNITVDWNIGLYLFSKPSLTVSSLDRETGITKEIDLSNESDNVVGYVVNSLGATTNFAVGFVF